MEHAGSVELPDRIGEVNTLIAGALQNLNRKYGKVFQALTFKEGGFLGSEAELRVCAQGEDTQTQIASIWITEIPGREPVMKDNYFGVIIKPQYLAAVRGIGRSLNENARVFCAGFLEKSFHDDLGLQTSLEDVLASGESLTGSLFVYAPVSEEELDILSRGLEEKMRARGLRGLVTLIALKDEGSAQVDDGNFADTMRFYADLRHEISNGIRCFLVSGEHAKL